MRTTRSASLRPDLFPNGVRLPAETMSSLTFEKMWVAALMIVQTEGVWSNGPDDCRRMRCGLGISTSASSSRRYCSCLSVWLT